MLSELPVLIKAQPPFKHPHTASVRMWEERHKQGGSESQWPLSAPHWWYSELTGRLTLWKSEDRLWGGGEGHLPKWRLSQRYWWHSGIPCTLHLPLHIPDALEASFGISSGKLETQHCFSKSGPQTSRTSLPEMCLKAHYQALSLPCWFRDPRTQRQGSNKPPSDSYHQVYGACQYRIPPPHPWMYGDVSVNA